MATRETLYLFPSEIATIRHALRFTAGEYRSRLESANAAMFFPINDTELGRMRCRAECRLIELESVIEVIGESV